MSLQSSLPEAVSRSVPAVDVPYNITPLRIRRVIPRSQLAVDRCEVLEYRRTSIISTFENDVLPTRLAFLL